MTQSLAQNIHTWILEQGLTEAECEDVVQGFGQRLVAGGVAVHRLSMGGLLLHPVIGAHDVIWEAKQDKVISGRVPRTVFTSTEFKDSPFFYSSSNKIRFARYKIEDQNVEREFPLFDKFREQGVTDYLVYFHSYGRDNRMLWADLPSGMEGVAFSMTTKRIGGFTDDEVEMITALTLPLALTVKSRTTIELARTILDSYLGSYSGGLVLDGLVERGDGRIIDCVLWYCDLRDSTALADRMALEEFLAMLNDYFDHTAGSVLEHGGEVLRYIGDAVIAIFPYEEGSRPPQAMARAALSTTRDAIARINRRNEKVAGSTAEPIRFGISMHVGQVMYGNIGTDERLEFSVIGPAANEVVRLEGLCKKLNTPVIASSTFRDICGEETIDLGRHEAAGVEGGVEAFTFEDFTS
jgi:adenylate cyclase